MKSLLEKGALSARRGVTQKINLGSFRTARLLFSIVLLAGMLQSCNNDTKGQTAQAKAGDSLPEPKVDIKVNRRYDEKGNMIGFDSTYTSYYSNMSGDTSQMDSLMGSFDRYFQQEHSSFFGRQFDPLFFNDSTRYPDFFHDDFFLRRYELNDPYMRGMMYRMDSIKNSFYKDHRKFGKKP
ncbi:MAG TPA: hypothetical protein VIM65_13825 [Cyclobacteriaceae bacterium]